MQTGIQLTEPLTGKVWELEDFDSHPALLVILFTQTYSFFKRFQLSDYYFMVLWILGHWDSSYIMKRKSTMLHFETLC